MKEIKGYEGLYSINENGDIVSHVKPNRRTEGFLKHCKDGKKYHYVVLFNRDRKHKMFKVHRLVAIHFIEKPLGKDHVNHIDGNKSNNHVSNLEWCTPKENTAHAMAIGLKVCFGVHSKKAKLNDETVLLCRKRYANGDSVRSMAKEIKISHQNLQSAVNGKTWKHI